MIMSESVNDLLCRFLAGDPSVADDLDRMADRLRELAQQIRNPQGKDGMKDPGGMSDRVQINVVGPDGSIKQQVDTR